MARRFTVVLSVALAAAMLGVPAFAAWSGNPNVSKGTQVVPPGAQVEGKNYKEWSAAWWQWVLSIPTTPDATGNPANPLWDTTGAYSMVGQSGKVLFLCGTQGGGAARDITIPTGRYLFFPLVNFEDDNVAWETYGKTHPFSPDELATELKGWVAVTNLANLYVTVDGNPIPEKTLMRGLVISPLFDYWLPPQDNLYGTGYDKTGIDPSGWVCPAISGGWWVMLKPLPAGEHSLVFGGGVNESPWGAFTTSAAYNIRVVESCVP